MPSPKIGGTFSTLYPSAAENWPTTPSGASSRRKGPIRKHYNDDVGGDAHRGSK
jgi:hypothetical protein